MYLEENIDMGMKHIDHIYILLLTILHFTSGFDIHGWC